AGGTGGIAMVAEPRPAPVATERRYPFNPAGVARSPDVSGGDECTGNKDFAGKPVVEITRSTPRPNRGGRRRNKSATGPSRVHCIPKSRPESYFCAPVPMRSTE